jgi:hypothetical protein
LNPEIGVAVVVDVDPMGGEPVAGVADERAHSEADWSVNEPTPLLR